MDSSAQWDGVALPAFVREVLHSELVFYFCQGLLSFLLKSPLRGNRGGLGPIQTLSGKPPGPTGARADRELLASGGLLSEPLPGAQQAVCDLPHRCLSRGVRVQM